MTVPQAIEAFLEISAEAFGAMADVTQNPAAAAESLQNVMTRIVQSKTGDGNKLITDPSIGKAVRG